MVAEVVTEVVAAVSLLIWLVLALGHGRFWRPPVGLPQLPKQRSPQQQLPGQVGAEPSDWPSVAVVVPARDEAEILEGPLRTVLRQGYAGPLRVLVVDDASTDGTGELAAGMGAEVVACDGPPPGWSGKVAAMAAGVHAAGDVDYLLFTDADIAHPADSVTCLVRAAQANGFDLVSQMVRLRTHTAWERLLMPAFVYFFAQLYPFDRVNKPGRTAAAAGGCMLVRRLALESAGGLDAIKDALIDDVALGRLLKRNGRVWLSLSPRLHSLRPYPRLADLWRMVARSAYTQLRCSVSLLLLTVVGLLLVYAVPPAAVATGIVTGRPALAALGLAAWAVMALTYVPLLRFHRVSAWTAPLLPGVALLYLMMTLDSARRHWLGRGGSWKGRVAQRAP